MSVAQRIRSFGVAKGGLGAPDLEMRVYSSAADFAAWWRREQPAARFYPFQNPHVMSIWEKTVGVGMEADCHVVCAHNVEGAAVLAYYFAAVRRGRRRVLTFMDGGVCDYNAPILFEPFCPIVESPEMLWQKMREVLPHYDMARLEKMPQDVLGVPNPLWPLADKGHAENGHVMRLPVEWAEIEREKGNRTSLQVWRRNQRRLAKFGEVTFMIPKDAGERERLFDLFVDQKKRRYLDMGVPDLFVEMPGFEAFYRGCLNEAQLDNIHLSALCVGDEVVATHFGFVDDRRFYYTMSAFQEGRWARYSCGNIHLEMLIRWGIERGLNSFDFGYGDEPYKSFWCDQIVELGDTSRIGSVREGVRQMFLAVNRRLPHTSAKGQGTASS
jgi:CelD/BcsL family acetyltransferase involved in cellulose biosynthesis